MILQTFYFAFSSATLHAWRAEVLAGELEITKCTQETATRLAYSEGFFLSVIEATGLFFYQHRFAGACGGRIPKQGWKDLDQERHAASRTISQLLSIEKCTQKGNTAAGADDHRGAHKVPARSSLRGYHRFDHGGLASPRRTPR